MTDQERIKELESMVAVLRESNAAYKEQLRDMKAALETLQGRMRGITNEIDIALAI